MDLGFLFVVMNVLELDGSDHCITYEHTKNHWNVGFKKVNFMVWIIAIKKNTGFVVLCYKCMLVAQSCPICDPMDCSPPGSSVPGILQANILEWVAIPFSRGSSWPRDRNQVFCFAGRFFASESHSNFMLYLKANFSPGNWMGNDLFKVQAFRPAEHVQVLIFWDANAVSCLPVSKWILLSIAVSSLSSMKAFCTILIGSPDVLLFV